MSSDLAERLQILHACWTVNSGTPSGDQYADDLAEAMLDNAEAIIAALDSHAAQSAELAKLRGRMAQIMVMAVKKRDSSSTHHQEKSWGEVVQIADVALGGPSIADIQRFTAALGEQGQTGGASEHGN